jgi:hypothetical protein
MCQPDEHVHASPERNNFAACQRLLLAPR